MVFQIVSGPADYAFNGKNENQELQRLIFVKDTQNRNKLVDKQSKLWWPSRDNLVTCDRNFLTCDRNSPAWNSLS